jgi:hypothetical protein
MDAFNYLSVLLSILLGLAIAEILQGYRKLVLSRRRIRPAIVPLAWSALILLFATQSWWASFGLSTHRDWSFIAFSMVLIQFGLLYMLAAVILPEIEDRECDLDAHFADVRRPFFMFLIAMLVASILKDVILDGRLPEARNLAFHGALIATSIIGIVASSRRIQIAIVVAAGIGAMFYIGLLFSHL